MDESAVVTEPAWRRRAGFVRLLLTGLPVVVIGGIIITFWVLSLLRSDEYKLLPVGAAAPPFSIVTATGEQVTLEQHLGKHPFMLYFNEGVG